jgi:aspartyl protease family protein
MPFAPISTIYSASGERRACGGEPAVSYAGSFGETVGRALGVALRETWGSLPTGLCVVAGALAFPAFLTQSLNAPRHDATAGYRRLAGSVDDRNQCYFRGWVNGAPFRLLLDTGASDLSFNQTHARQLGFNPAQLHFNQSIATANGLSWAAPIHVQELRLGDLVLRNVAALVDEAGADSPLLGTSVLWLLQVHVEFGRGACWLTW